MSDHDLHKVIDKADVWFVVVSNEQLLFSVLTIFLFFKTQFDTADSVRFVDGFLVRDTLVGPRHAFDIFGGKCVRIAESIFMVATDACIVGICLGPFNSSTTCIQVA